MFYLAQYDPVFFGSDTCIQSVVRDVRRHVSTNDFLYYAAASLRRKQCNDMKQHELVCIHRADK
jgi:hypothetical protein